MMVIWGLTSGQLGRIEASAIQTFSTPRTLPFGSTGCRSGLPPAAAVPTGWNAARCNRRGSMPRNASWSSAWDRTKSFPATTSAALTPHTAAVVVVHIGGLITPQIDELRALCDERGIALVEDAAHAHGSAFDGRFAGSFGVAAAFSFYPTKVVTSGEGGMVLTSSEELAQEARIYRDQGKGAFSANHHVRLGSAWRMSELHAATGLVHVRRMGEYIARRRDVAARYDKALAGLDGLQPLAEPPGCRSNVYKYIVLLPPGLDRAWFKSELAQRYVSVSGEVYDLPLHRQPVLADYAGPPLPVAEELAARHICLPVHSDMTDNEVDEVLTAVAAVHDAFTGR